MTQIDIRPSDIDDTPTPDPGCACTGGCASSGRSVTRRAAIGAGVVTGAALLAACGSSDTATTSKAGSSTTAGTTPSATSSSTSASSSSSASSSAGAGSVSESDAPETEGGPVAAGTTAPSGTEIAKVADVPSGGSLIVSSGDQQIALARNADGSVVAHTAICTHQGCAVKAAGATLSCPCHGSAFDAFTGAATKGPATQALDAITVSASGDAVYLV